MAFGCTTLGYLAVVLLHASCFGPTSGQLYIDESYPYGWGELAINITTIGPLANDSTIPMHNRIYYPLDNDYEYATHYFIGGFGGVVPSTTYDEYLGRIASHGYVVSGSWPFLGDDGRNFTYEAHLANIEWLEENLEDEIEGLRTRFDILSMNCHSAGCGRTLEIEYYDPDRVTAQVFYEPVSSTFLTMTPENLGPALIYGAEVAGNCVSMFEHTAYYNFYNCENMPMLLEGEGVGHCDVLDPVPWAACIAGFCPPGISAPQLEEYHDFAAGMAVSFMNAYQQGEEDYLDHLLDRERIPWDLSMYNVTCYHDDDDLRK